MEDLTPNLPLIRVEATGQNKLNRVVSPALLAFNRLVWQPVATMHPSWWQELQLTLWQAQSQAGTRLAQRIEAVVVSRYGLVGQDLPQEFNELEANLLACRHKLSAIVTALGLFLLNRPDYVSLREYRDALHQELSHAQIQQIWNLWPQRPQLTTYAYRDEVTATELVGVAQTCAINLIGQLWGNKPFWRALALTLPVQATLPCKADSLAPISLDIPRWLMRLERLL